MSTPHQFQLKPSIIENRKAKPPNGSNSQLPMAFTRIGTGSRPEIKKNILATIAYYDGMDYPLTGFEVWKYLTKFVISNLKFDKSELRIANYELQNSVPGCSLAEVLEELEANNLRRCIEKDRGFYFWRGRKELVDQRIKRDKISVAKIKKLRRVVKFLRFIPFIQMIGVTGALAMKNADYGSDWDVLIILKNGRIWTGRTLITGFLHLIGKRRHKEKIKDRVCLNYFITDESLELITQDFLSASEYFFMFPIFDTGIFQKFQFRNSWIKDYKPNFYLREVGKIEEIGIIRMIRKIGEIILGWDFLENWLGKWQREKIMKNPLTKKPGSFIRATDEHLIFLPEPHGPELIEHLRQKTGIIIS